jgi:tRNA nucleotidyltransferase (CCA-adding enzyme)
VARLLGAHACRVGRLRVALPSSRMEVRRWLSRVGLDRADAVLTLAEAEARALPLPRRDRARREVNALRRRVSEMKKAPPPLGTQDLALDGRAVMRILAAGPGPHVGEALRHLLDRVLEDPAVNSAEALERELRAWSADRPHTA